MRTKIVVIALICLMPVSGLYAESRDAMIDTQLVLSKKEDSTMTDGKAKIYALEGKAIMMPQGSPVEKNLKVGDEIKAGDSVYTEKGTTLSISFDKGRQNAVRIPADSKVIFTSIEPTNIKLENGSIFSVINGLAKGSTWKVTTPSAVAAVRGTVFLVRYESASGKMYAATVNVPNDGKISAIEIQSLTGEGNAQVTEGKEISLKEGEVPSTEMVRDLSSDQIGEVQSFFEQVSAESDVLEKSGDGDSDDDGAVSNKGEEKIAADDGGGTGEDVGDNTGTGGPGDDLGNDLGGGPPGDDLGNDLGGGPGDDGLPPIGPGPEGDGSGGATNNDGSNCKVDDCGDDT